MADQYCDKADVKNRIGLSGSGQDNNIDNAINAASRQIDALTGRVFWKTATAEAKYFNAVNPFFIDLPYDIANTTSLSIALDTTDDGTYDSTLVLDTDYYVLPLAPKVIAVRDGITYYEPYNQIRILETRSSERFDIQIPKNIKITAFWGYDIIPDAIAEACIIQATRLWKRKDAPFNVYGSADTGQVELRSKFDTDALELIKTHIKHRI